MRNIATLSTVASRADKPDTSRVRAVGEVAKRFRAIRLASASEIAARIVMRRPPNFNPAEILAARTQNKRHSNGQAHKPREDTRSAHESEKKLNPRSRARARTRRVPRSLWSR